MTAPIYCVQCTTPDLCLIACPNNLVLEQMKYRVHQRALGPDEPSKPEVEPPAEDDQELQIVFQEDEEQE